MRTRVALRYRAVGSALAKLATVAVFAASGLVDRGGDAMADEAVTEWALDGVLDELARIHNSMKDRQFAFILGAGASFTSGIPTGHHLAQRWLKDLHLRECVDQRPLHEWIASCGIGKGSLTWDTAANHYPQIFERRFDGDREAGYAELEAAMEGKSPSLGLPFTHNYQPLPSVHSA